MPDRFAAVPAAVLAKARGAAQKRFIPRSEFPGRVLLFPTEGKLMKKVLFATTALVATASVAAADVTFSGYGRFGLEYRDIDATGEDSTNLTSRLRLQIDASAESDAGVTFGARVRFHPAKAQTTPMASQQAPHLTQTAFASSHVPVVLKLVLVTSSALWNSCLACTQSTWV